jgi:uncharacterized membrane protein
MKRLVRLLMPIVIAGGLGPLAGGLAASLLLVVQYVAHGLQGPATELIGMSLLFVGFAYLGGWPIALLAGLLMSVWMSFRAPGHHRGACRRGRIGRPALARRRREPARARPRHRVRQFRAHPLRQPLRRNRMLATRAPLRGAQEGMINMCNALQRARRSLTSAP